MCLHVPLPPRFTPYTPPFHPASMASKTPLPAPTNSPSPPLAPLAAIEHVTKNLGGGQVPLWIYQAVRAVYQVSYKKVASMAGRSETRRRSETRKRSEIRKRSETRRKRSETRRKRSEMRRKRSETRRKRSETRRSRSRSREETTQRSRKR